LAPGRNCVPVAEGVEEDSVEVLGDVQHVEEDLKK
jgi:hypothetical protein